MFDQGDEFPMGGKTGLLSTLQALGRVVIVEAAKLMRKVLKQKSRGKVNDKRQVV